jgi:hypothetical protein
MQLNQGYLVVHLTTNVVLLLFDKIGYFVKISNMAGKTTTRIQLNH